MPQKKTPTKTTTPPSQIKVNLTLDRETWLSAKAKKAERGMSISFAINKFLAQWVKDN